MNSRRDDLEARIADAEARERALRSGDGYAAFAEEEDVEEGTAGLLAASRRLSPEWAETGQAALGFIRRHPLAVAGGALALGAAVSLLVPGSPVRKAGQSLGGRALARSSILKAAAAQFALAFGSHLLDVMEEAQTRGKEGLEGAGDTVAQAAEAAKRAALEAGKSIAGSLRR